MERQVYMELVSLDTDIAQLMPLSAHPNQPNKQTAPDNRQATDNAQRTRPPPADHGHGESHLPPTTDLKLHSLPATTPRLPALPEKPVPRRDTHHRRL